MTPPEQGSAEQPVCDVRVRVTVYMAVTSATRRPADSPGGPPAAASRRVAEKADQAVPGALRIQASTKASSSHALYRPLRPPCPATISVFSRNGPPRARACSFAIHLAGSLYRTRVSFRLVTARTGGYSAVGETFSYGVYDFMYAYTCGSCSGSPHSSHSVTVSGSDGSRIVVSAYTNGTWATIPPNAAGARLTTAPISSPPALPPRATSRCGDVHPALTRCSALATKSVNVLVLCSSFPSSYHRRPISPPPRMCAIA